MNFPSRNYLKYSVVVSFLLLLTMVCVFGFTLIHNFHFIEDRTNRMNQTVETIADIQELKATIKGAEANLKDAILRGDEDYLDDYIKGKKTYSSLLDVVRQDLKDSNDDNVLSQIEELQGILDKRFARFEVVLNIYNTQGRAGIDSLHGQKIGLNLNFKIDAILENLLNKENQKQSHREALFHDAEKLMTQFLVSLIVIAFIAFGFTGFVIWKLIAHEQHQKYLRKYATELEGQVESRTLALTESHKEMESFSYSVSHDLRAPLRAIEGYSNILMEEFSEKLGDEGVGRVKVIIRNVRQMGQLIDDILSFSRLGRKDILKTNTNLNKMAGNTLEEIRRSPHFKGDHTIKINDLGFANVDSGIFRQVFSNLIGNAVKFSHKNDHPEIVVGVMESDPKTYYVRDNGVGFDMKHSNMLFTVFSRLHSNEEFDGTGVGLAIVKKIITKHDGKIWAESSPGCGATFYFSLP